MCAWGPESCVGAGFLERAFQFRSCPIERLDAREIEQVEPGAVDSRRMGRTGPAKAALTDQVRRDRIEIAMRIREALDRFARKRFTDGSALPDLAPPVTHIKRCQRLVRLGMSADVDACSCHQLPYVFRTHWQVVLGCRSLPEQLPHTFKAVFAGSVVEHAKLVPDVEIQMFSRRLWRLPGPPCRRSRWRVCECWQADRKHSAADDERAFNRRAASKDQPRELVPPELLLFPEISGGQEHGGRDAELFENRFGHPDVVNVTIVERQRHGQGR